MFVIVDEPLTQALIVRRVTVLERLTAKVRCRWLDHDLADGASPEADALHALRARTLQRSRFRARCAVGVERVLAVVDGHAVWPPISPRAVAGSRPTLLTLSYRLRAPGPIPTQALALVHLLLVDALSPLYRTGADTGLDAYLEHVSAVMNLVPRP